MQNILDTYKMRAREFISKHVEINEHDWQEFSKIMEYIELPKNRYLTQNGEVENYLYYLAEGVIRIFVRNHQQEYTFTF